MIYLIKYVFQHDYVFSMITGINESKKLTNLISGEYKCRFDGRKCNSDECWNSVEC